MQHANRRGFVALTLAFGLSAAACGSSSRVSSTTPTVSSTPAAGVVKCTAPAARGTRTLALTIDGHPRTVIVHEPTTRSSAVVPLIVNLHGSGSDARGQERFSGMDATADAHGFVVAYPQAAIRVPGGFDWNVPGVPLRGGASVPAGAANDESFLTRLVPMLQPSDCIDPTRVYVTGMSGGGRMASQLGCDAAPVFAAVAPVAGLRFPSPCPATGAVPIVAFHGTADAVDPFDGNGQAYWTYSVPTAAQRWATHNHCAGPAPTPMRPGVGETLYGGCRDDATVVLYAIADEGHEWPGGPTMPRAITRVLGAQSSAIDANDVMWQFFAAHPRR